MFGLENLFKLIKFKKLSHKHSITPKGECYIHYIINKYVNATKPDDYIDAYEQMITKNEDRVKQIPQFKEFYTDMNGNEVPSMVHFIAANLALSLILISLKEEEIQKYLTFITNPKAKNFINILAHPDKRIKNLTTN